MGGPNPTGKARTDDYQLGRGIPYFATLDANDRPTAWRDLGNSPEFNLSIETETLEHTSSRQGLAVVDKEVTISQKLSVTFQLDELNHENLALFFSGAKATHINVTIAGFTEYAMIPDPTVELGRWYDIVNSSGERAYDVLIADLTMVSSNITPVTLDVDVDFELDSEMGRVFLLSTSGKVSTIITNNEDVDVTLVARAGASDVDEVRTLTQTSVTGALKFIGVNPASSNEEVEYTFHKISLKAEGDLAEISDEWSVMSLTGTAERNETAEPDSPTLTIRKVNPSV